MGGSRLGSFSGFGEAGETPKEGQLLGLRIHGPGTVLLLVMATLLNEFTILYDHTWHALNIHTIAPPPYC
jgi:hypothetical protein